MPRTSDLALIQDAHRLVHAIGLQIAERFGNALTQAEALILAELAREGPQSVGALHRAFGHRRSTLTNVLDRLEAKGYIAPKRSPDDARVIVAHLTKAGKVQAGQVVKLFRELEDRIPKTARTALAEALPPACEALGELL